MPCCCACLVLVLVLVWSLLDHGFFIPLGGDLVALWQGPQPGRLRVLEIPQLHAVLNHEGEKVALAERDGGFGLRLGGGGEVEGGGRTE